MRRLKQILKDHRFSRLIYATLLSALALVSPRANTKVRYRVSKGEAINLEHPSKFNEKISWLKLHVYSHSELVAQCANKARARSYVADLGAAEILTDLYGVFKSPKDLQWESLPDRFVLKWSNGSGGAVICHNKKEIDRETVVKQLEKSARSIAHLYSAEFQYNKVPNQLLCEQMISGDGQTVPIDYKFYCYEGVPKIVLVCAGRFAGPTQLFFYDMSWNRIHGIFRPSKEAPPTVEINKPEGFERAAQYAALLSTPFPFVRVDLYIENGRTFFGELTFTPCGGIDSKLTRFGDEFLGNHLEWLFQARGEH